MRSVQMFNLCMYLATSTEGLQEGPKQYGPLRLLGVLERLAVYAAKAHDDAFLSDIASEVRRRRTSS